MKEFKAILEQFDSKRNVLKYKGLWNESVVADCFYPCAKEILLGGYFLIDNKYVIDLGSIELYYHEEEEEITETLALNDSRGRFIPNFADACSMVPFSTSLTLYPFSSSLMMDFLL